jgi:hypothetical protein
MALRDQIHAASERNTSGARLEAVAVLKAQVPTRNTVLELCELIRSDLHPAERAAVAQVLGFHRCCTRFPDVGALICEYAQEEKDPMALRAMIFALRGCEGVTKFVNHRGEGVALEVVLNSPTDTASLQVLLQAAFGALPETAFDVFCGRLKGFANTAPHLVALLMTLEWSGIGEFVKQRVRRAFGELSQEVLFEALIDVRGEIERTYKSIWPGIWRRESQRHLLEHFLEMLGSKGVDRVLIDTVLKGVVADEGRYGDYVRFVRSLVGVLNTRAALDWIAACDRMGEKADRALLSRLAETLVCLVGNAPLVAAETQAVLAKWEHQLPGVRMKAFHAAR